MDRKKQISHERWSVGVQKELDDKNKGSWGREGAGRGCCCCKRRGGWAGRAMAVFVAAANTPSLHEMTSDFASCSNNQPTTHSSIGLIFCRAAAAAAAEVSSLALTHEMTLTDGTFQIQLYTRRR
jgi:hypothetical protein